MLTTLVAALLIGTPPSVTVTVDGVDRPVCYMEDGSDSPTLPCVWFNDGAAWLTFGDYSLPINP